VPVAVAVLPESGPEKLKLTMRVFPAKKWCGPKHQRGKNSLLVERVVVVAGARNETEVSVRYFTVDPVLQRASVPVNLCQLFRAPTSSRVHHGSPRYSAVSTLCWRSEKLDWSGPSDSKKHCGAIRDFDSNPEPRSQRSSPPR
jgi:hypothetical protein